MSRLLSALVIGNSKYANVDDLKNPAHDADDIAVKLDACGFAVTKLIDASHKNMDRALAAFKRSLKGQDVGLFFFAGHGIQVDGGNFLAASDTEMSDDENDAKHSALSLNKIIDAMETAGTATNIIILDACRNNPWERAWRRLGPARGLAPVYAPKGTLIAFATSPGQTAADGQRRNGAYTEALLAHIDLPDCSIETMFKYVRNTLSANTRGKQISWEHTSLSGEFHFNMSVGARITDYGQAAVKDKLFVLEDARASHQLIRKLKSLTWGTQNSALESVKQTDLAKCTPDNLFVIGRNIYQAACGNAHTATAFITTFMNRTSGIPDEKRKALLDGMLFEIFFNPLGIFRDEPKVDRFSELFQLQQFTQLTASFEFISECLLPHAGRFYAVPGKAHTIAIHVSIGPGKKTPISRVNSGVVDAVTFGGVNILWLEDEDYKVTDPDDQKYRNYSRSDFEEKICTQILFPAHLVNITYGVPVKNLDYVQFPRGYTVRKQ